MATRAFRAVLIAAALSCSLGPGRASAVPITYTSANIPFGDTISITAPNAVISVAGQIVLTTGSITVLAWCIDIFHHLTSPVTYSSGLPSVTTSLDSSQIARIGGLM